VFDDQADIGALAVSRLGHLGFNAKCVVEKAAFLATLEYWRPELILLDLSLRDTDAIELFGLLTEQGFRGQVILMSGHSETVISHARRLGESAGITIPGILNKPFLQCDLRALVAGLGMGTTRPRLDPVAQTCAGLLRAALDNKWLEFWYQPKVDLRTNLIVGAESVARIRHPEAGVLAPAVFLKHASDEDLYELTTKALDEALICVEKMERRNRPLAFSINVAAQTFARSGLIDDFRAIRERCSTKRPIILEVTETDYVEDKAAVESFATRAILHGFQISIDDFGQGYASFERLRDMPFTEIKLERSMVNGCARDPTLRRICYAVVQLAHGFGASAVAEGVERDEDLQTVRTLGFDVAQGYYFSRPLPFRDFERLANGCSTATGEATSA
jgi:EAL domain-containing protein (putative c-di-GMP-specific phosphodiesterase class I)